MEAATALDLVIRSAVVYVALLVVLRVFGKREIGQFTLHDLVFILLVANAVQPAVTGPDTSVTGGIVIILTLAALNLAIARLEQLPFFRRYIVSRPTVVIKDGTYLEDAMRHEQVDRALCEMVMREHGVDNVRDVKLGVLETDGTISIVPTDARTFRSQHGVRGRGL